MDTEELNRAFQIRYVKLRFEIRFREASRLPKNKVSAIRGAKGDMQIPDLPGDLLLVLLAGEVMHIGKNTSFGFGRYLVQ